MRLRSLLVLLCLAAPAAAHPAPAPTQNAIPVPGWKPPKDDAVLTNGNTSVVRVVTDKGKAELEAQPDFASRTIVLRNGATDAHAATMVAKLPWITNLVTDEPVELTTLASIAKLRALKHLHINTTRITSIAPLANHPALTSLTLSCGTSFTDTDLTTLGTIPTLERIELRCPAIKDFTGIEKLPKLNAFVSWSSPVTKLDPLARHTKLSALILRSTQVTDLSPIAGAVDMRQLDLTGIKAATFAPLRSMTKLGALTVDETNIADLSVITSPDLFSFQARDAKLLTTFTGLPAQPKLAHLGLDGSGITTIDPLATMTGLYAVSFERTAVVHIGALNRLPNLKSVSLPTAVPDAEIIALQSAIPGIGVTRYNKPIPGFVPGPPIP